MKRTVIAVAIGLAGTLASVLTSNAQGYVTLDNYASSGQIIAYGAGSGGTTGTGVSTAFTVGLYYALGTVSVNADPTGIADPSTLGAIVLGSGAGATTPILSNPGYFSATTGFNVGGTAGSTVTLEIVAYNGASYDASTVRGHSTAFQIADVGATAPIPAYVGTVMPGFDVFAVAVPEPATFALVGLGGLSLMLFRRRK